MTFLFDTNILLNFKPSYFDNLEEKFYLSSITINELEEIKSSGKKDEETKYNARKILHWLEDNKDKYEIIVFHNDFYDIIDAYNLPKTIDSSIIATAYQFYKNVNLEYPKDSRYFVTDDLACRAIARSIGIPVYDLGNTEEEEYTGYKIIKMEEEELSEFYSTVFPQNENKYQLLTNEYLLIESDNKIIDKYKWNGEVYEAIPFIKFESETFGKIVPFKGDVFQQIAMDSLSHHQVTLLGGPAGSGKTFLALGYLFSLLERNKIDRIVIFVNPMGARNAAKLGFYKGTVREKVLSTQVGHVLASKIGSLYEVERLLDSEVLQIIPVVDARGYEVPPHSGVYVLESQNLTSDLLRLILQRTGEDSKVIVDGDRLEQLDSDIYFKDNGMEKMSKVFRGNELFGQVDLKNIYRSKIASLAQQMK